MGKFLIRALRTGFRADLLASNGEVIASSEAYASMAACLRGIGSIRRCSSTTKILDLTVDSDPPTNPRFELYRDMEGEYRFVLRARNGQIVADSEAYVTYQGCRKGIRSVQENGPDATLEYDGDNPKYLDKKLTSI